MRLDVGPELEAFRDEIATFLDEHREGELHGVDEQVAGFMGAAEAGSPARAAAWDRWEAALAEARLICPQWPEEVGGRGLSGVQMAILNEEFAPAGLPRVIRGMGESLVGPSIIVHGTERAEGALPAPDHRGHRPLLPGLLGARPRFGSGRGRDPGGRRRRRDRRERPEGVDLGRPPRQHDVRPVPDGPRRPQAPGALLRARADAAGRRARPTGSTCARSSRCRGQRVLPGVHRGRPRPAVQRHRRASTTGGGSP